MIARLGILALCAALSSVLAACGDEKAAGESYRNAAGRMVAARSYLDALAKEAGILKTPSGLLYRVDRRSDQPDGTSPGYSDDVLVHYRGALPDGDEFESSYDRNVPAQFAVSDLIAGWREGLTLMRAGDAYTFYIPPQLAYGPRGHAPVIPPNSVLVYQVELLAVYKDDPRS